MRRAVFSFPILRQLLGGCVRKGALLLAMLGGMILVGAETTTLRGEEVSSPAAEQALVKYVQKPDASYRWTKRREGTLGSTKWVELTLCSQTWHDIVWKHQLYILKPASIKADCRQALFLIEGGSWREELAGPPAANEKMPGDALTFAAAAEALGSPVAVLLHVPQQPIFEGKKEDAIISYTFEQYLKTGNSDWPLLLPMVKSAVRGMDAVQEFTTKEWSLDLKAFTVAGASKRGWTTWLTSAVDSRVKALAPMVIDVLNMEPQMKHQREAYGGYSEQIRDYTDRGLQDALGSAKGKSLRAIVDPYSYREKIAQPKLILLGTNDPYWTLDALNLYWDGLSGDKYITYVPNAGHGLKDFARVVGGINALHQHSATGQKLPKLDWKFEPAGDKVSLRLSCDVKPDAVVAWSASSASHDFRKSQWSSTACRSEDGCFCQDLVIPKSGCAAMFAEAKFPGQALPFFLSTTIRIVEAKP